MIAIWQASRLSDLRSPATTSSMLLSASEGGRQDRVGRRREVNMAGATGKGTATLGLNAVDGMIACNGHEALADLGLAFAIGSLRVLKTIRVIIDLCCLGVRQFPGSPLGAPLPRAGRQ